MVLRRGAGASGMGALAGTGFSAAGKVVGAAGIGAGRDSSRGSGAAGAGGDTLSRRGSFASGCTAGAEP